VKSDTTIGERLAKRAASISNPSRSRDGASRARRETMVDPKLLLMLTVGTLLVLNGLFGGRFSG
jgi:hypothetical protein